MNMGHAHSAFKLSATKRNAAAASCNQKDVSGKHCAAIGMATWQEVHACAQSMNAYW